jgi:hypothetical protein
MSSDEYTTHHDLDDLYPRVEYTKLAFKKQPSKYLTPVKRQGTIYTSLLK